MRNVPENVPLGQALWFLDSADITVFNVCIWQHWILRTPKKVNHDTQL